MRLDRIAAADLRRDAALASRRGQGDAASSPARARCWSRTRPTGSRRVIAAALEDWREGDAQIVVTAGSLTPARPCASSSSEHPNALCRRDLRRPAVRAEIEALLRAGGPGRDRPDAMAATSRRCRARSTPATSARRSRSSPSTSAATRPRSTPADVAAVAPLSTEAELDDLLHAVAEAGRPTIGPLLRRLEAQGVAPVTLCIAASPPLPRAARRRCRPRRPGRGHLARAAARLRAAPRPDAAGRRRRWGAMRPGTGLRRSSTTPIWRCGRLPPAPPTWR